MSIFKKYLKEDKSFDKYLKEESQKTIKYNGESKSKIPKRVIILVLFIFSMPVIFAGLVILCKKTIWKDIEIEGVSSTSNQYRTFIFVRGRGCLPVFNHYTDVIVRDEQGIEVSRWIDVVGQASDEKAHEVLKSIRWANSSNIEFTANKNEIFTLTIPK